MHAIIPASRRRIPIAYFRACTWSRLRGCFAKFLHPCTPLVTVSVYLSRTWPPRSFVLVPVGSRCFLVRSDRREFTIGNVNRELDVKAASLLKNTGASPSCVPTKEAFGRWNETHGLFVEPAPATYPRCVPVRRSCPAPTISSYVQPILYLRFYLLVRIAFAGDCLRFTDHLCAAETDISVQRRTEDGGLIGKS